MDHWGDYSGFRRHALIGAVLRFPEAALPVLIDQLLILRLPHIPNRDRTVP